MKAKKYREYPIQRTICNVPNANFDLIVPFWESFKIPPIGIYYETWSGRKEPLDESFYKYCSSDMSNDIWEKEGLDFLYQNLVPILCGEIEGWRLIGVTVKPYSTRLWIAEAKGQNKWYFINIEPNTKTLRLRFESQSEIGEVQHHYKLRREIPLGHHLYIGRKTQLVTHYLDKSCREACFSDLYEWLTKSNYCLTDIIGRI